MSYKIDKTSGCGGFLNPPGHPEHTISIRGYGKDESITNLSYAAGEGKQWLPQTIVEQAEAILGEWEDNKPPIDKDWVHRVLGYFRGCYAGPQNDETRWHASNFTIRKQDFIPETEQDISNHAGVNLIWKYYPTFTPTREDFEQAYWGKKPE